MDVHPIAMLSSYVSRHFEAVLEMSHAGELETGTKIALIRLRQSDLRALFYLLLYPTTCGLLVPCKSHRLL